MRHTYTYLSFITILLAGCGKQSDSVPLERAEQLSRQALIEMNTKQYSKAERLLLESIELYSEANNSAKLAEHYALLSSVQLMSGKLHPALQSLTTLRNFYKQVADRNSEINTMLEIARTNFNLGRIKQAITILDEAYLSSQLFQLYKHYGESAFELGRMYSVSGRFNKASEYFAQSSAQFLQIGDTNKAVDAIAENIKALLKSGSQKTALSYFKQLEELVQYQNEPAIIANAYLHSGESFLKSEEYSIANKCFYRALHLTDSSSTAQNSHITIQIVIGLGESYFNMYDFIQAQREYIKAFAFAKGNSGNNIVQAYLLIRIADCEIKKRRLSYSSDQLIRTSQLYESAQTLLSRAGFGFGEALVLHRLGMLKELSGDDNSAITHYKRAYEKFVDNNFNVDFLSLPVNYKALYTLSGRNISAETWFSERLSALLLQYKKSDDALEYIERSRSMTILNDMIDLDIQFGEKGKQKIFDDFISSLSIKKEFQFELFRFSKNVDQDYAAQLTQKVVQFRKSYNSASDQMIQNYPELKILSATENSYATAKALVPPGSTVLRYYFVENDLWCIIAQNGKQITSLKLSSFGLELKKKMHSLISMVSASNKQSYELTWLSQELYKILVAPLERYGQQKFIIVPPDGLEKFPYHALTKNGKPLLEMIEVSYLPSVLFLQGYKQPPGIISSVVGIGFSPDSRSGLEFELRDIRSFFRNAQILVNQSATVQRLTSATGELLQISSTFRRTSDNEPMVSLSDGSASLFGVNAPISIFTSCHPFYSVYLSDVQQNENGIDNRHSILWLMNSSRAVITTELPATSKMNRSFAENYYSSFSSTFSPYVSYRKAVLQIAAQQEFSEGLHYGSYFYYGL